MMQKIIKLLLLFFVFVLALGIVFWGIQWFSNSLENIGKHKLSQNIIFSGSLQASVSDAQAKVGQAQTIAPNLLPLRNWQVEDLKSGAQAALSVKLGFNEPRILFKKNEEKNCP